MSETLRVLITGATDGIGRETAHALARRGAAVILHGRSDERLQATKASFEAETGSRSIAAVQGDLASFAEIHAMADHLLDRFPAIDVLINNAGVYQKRWEPSVDGIERTLAVNHLAPFLLTHRLLPALARAPRGRIVNVASIAHQRGRIDLGDLELRADFDPYRAYAQSKLANILFTRELARRLGPASTITVNALHPGVVGTKLLTEGFEIEGSDSVEEGSATSVFLAVDPSVAAVTGAYFVRCREAEPSAAARDPALARRLYERSCAMVAIDGLPEPTAGADL